MKKYVAHTIILFFEQILIIQLRFGVKTWMNEWMNEITWLGSLEPDGMKISTRFVAHTIILFFKQILIIQPQFGVKTWMNEWVTRIGSLEPDGMKIYTRSGWQNLWPILSSSFAANFNHPTTTLELRHEQINEWITRNR
jgi:hypothetical protein